MLTKQKYSCIIKITKQTEVIDMKNVMVRAWEIAREGAARFGGKAVEYIAVALKMAWAEVKKGSKKVTVRTTMGSKHHKSWVARIVGTHVRWGLDREFVDAVEENDWDGKVFELCDGIYEVCNAGDREFIKVENGAIEYIEIEEVKAAVA